MSKYSISPNAACQFNYLRISYQRFYSTQNLKICLNEVKLNYVILIIINKYKEYADSHNSLKKKTLSYKSFSRFVNLSNENKNTKKKQVFEENLLKRVQEAPKIFLRFKDDIIYVSNFLNFRYFEKS